MSLKSLREASQVVRQLVDRVRTRVVVEAHQRGVLYQDGRATAWLEPGAQTLWSVTGQAVSVALIDLDQGFSVWRPEIAALMPADAAEEVTLEAHEGAVLLIDGAPQRWLGPGRYFLWQLRRQPSLQRFDLREPTGDLTGDIAKVIPSSQLIDCALGEHERGVLYIDGRPVRWLEPGRHFIWQRHRSVQVQRLDLERGLEPWTLALRAVVPSTIAEEVVVSPHEAAFLIIDDQPVRWVKPGRYLRWSCARDVQVARFDTTTLAVDLPEPLARLAPGHELLQVTLNDEERGVLFADGCANTWLTPGRHHFWKRMHALSVQQFNIRVGYLKHVNELDQLIPKGEAHTLHVGADEVAILIRDEHPKACLSPGRYHLWQQREKVRAEVHAMTSVRSSIPERCWPLVPEELMVVETILPHQRGVLYVDGVLSEVLSEGRHALNTMHQQVEVCVIETRERALQINGQEIITADKVSLRVNLIVKYRVEDPLRCVEQQTNLHDSLYSEAQMAARRYVAGVTIDQLLEQRDEARASMTHAVAERARDWGVAVLQIDLKDVILPGEMKHLLNSVIEAEKRAAAELITRREEIASTRSQINTARMLDRHPTLMRLRELDVLRDVAGRVERLTIVAGADDVLQQLRAPRPDADA